MKLYRKSSLFLLVLSLQGCAVPMIVSMGIGAASVAVNETTGKTVTDHVVSTVNGKDCKMSRKMQGKDVCQDQPDAEPTVVAKDKPKLDIPPVTPQPQKVVVVQNTSVYNMEAIFAQRRSK